MKLSSLLLLTLLLAILSKVESNTQTVNSLLEKMSNSDQDLRYMGLRDLMAEFKKDNFRLDEQSEEKLVDKVLEMLGDKIGEVQTESVRCLGQMIKIVKPKQITKIVDTLCTNMMSTDAKMEQLKELSSGALKTSITQLPASLAPIVSERVTGKLIAIVEKEATSASVAVEALTILSDLLARFSGPMSKTHNAVANFLLPQLMSQKPAVRARTIDALSNLVVTCNADIYGQVVNHLIQGLESKSNQAQIRTNIQCLASIWRSAGHRLCSYVDRVITLVTKFSEKDDDELREYCNQAYESFVKQCPDAIKPHIQTILESSLNYIKYDPNYIETDDDSESENEANDDDSDEETVDGDDDEFGDDDDMSWRVRYSAAKILEAIISVRPDLIDNFYKTVSPALIARFKEREEKVKSDIFSAYIALVRSTKAAESSSGIESLKKQIPDIVKNIQLLLRGKSLKTRQSCFALLNELVNTVPGALDNTFKQLVPGIENSLGDTDSNLKIDAVSFLSHMLVTHESAVLRAHISTLVPHIVKLVRDSSYKVANRALKVLPSLYSILRSSEQNTPLDAGLKPSVVQMYESTLKQLQAQKSDGEAKERLILCLAQIISHFGDALDTQLPESLPLFLDYLRSDATRSTAIEALATIARSPFHVNLTPILSQAIELTGSFLQKSDRALKPTLSLLNILVSNYHSYIESALLKDAIADVPQLLSNADSEVIQKTLILVTSIASHKSDVLNGIHKNILSKLPNFVRLPMLQDTTNVRLFEALAVAKLPGLGFRDLFNILRSLAMDESQHMDEKIMHSIAKCAAALTNPLQNEAIPLANELLADIKKNGGDRKTVFSLLTIGEIGRNIKLSATQGVLQSLIDAFESTSEDVKSAAARALGAIAVGDASTYLPSILKQIESKPAHQYLLLDALYEFISSLSKTSTGFQQLQPLIPSIWTQLVENSESSETKVRNTITKCIGLLVSVRPEELYPSLQKALIDGSPLKKTVLLSAIGFTISNQPQPIDTLLRQNIGQLLSDTLTDNETIVRHAAVVVLDLAINKKPSLVRDSLPSLMPLVYAEAKIKPELVKVVAMGPVKHRIDNGTENRRAAYNCMQLLLARNIDVINVSDFVDQVQIGMNDVEIDIQKQAYFLTTRLAALYPNELLPKLDIFIAPLQTVCESQPGPKEEWEEPVKFKNRIVMKRLALQTLSHILAAVPNADKNPKVAEFLKIIQNSAELRKYHQEVKNETWDA